MPDREEELQQRQQEVIWRVGQESGSARDVDAERGQPPPAQSLATPPRPEVARELEPLKRLRLTRAKWRDGRGVVARLHRLHEETERRLLDAAAP
jgi:hypothetical protein